MDHLLFLFVEKYALDYNEINQYLPGWFVRKRKGRFTLM